MYVRLTLHPRRRIANSNPSAVTQQQHGICFSSRHNHNPQHRKRQIAGLGGLHYEGALLIFLSHFTQKHFFNWRFERKHPAFPASQLGPSFCWDFIEPQVNNFFSFFFIFLNFFTINLFAFLFLFFSCTDYLPAPAKPKPMIADICLPPINTHKQAFWLRWNCQDR